MACLQLVKVSQVLVILTRMETVFQQLLLKHSQEWQNLQQSTITQHLALIWTLLTEQLQQNLMFIMNCSKMQVLEFLLVLKSILAQQWREFLHNCLIQQTPQQTDQTFLVLCLKVEAFANLLVVMRLQIAMLLLITWFCLNQLKINMMRKIKFLLKVLTITHSIIVLG